MPAPAVLAAIAAAKVTGGLVGGIGNYNDVQRGMAANKNYYDQGAQYLNDGKAGSDAAYKPYTDAGQQGVAGLTGAVGSYRDDAMNGMPTQQTTTAQGTQAWLDPSANYSMDQSNRAIQASALAKGGMGGGLAKALSNNAQKMAMTNWNSAYAQQLGANQQNFAQGNQIWQNQKGVLDSNVANMSGLTNVGLNANQANQGNQLAYNTNLNTNRTGLGDNMQSGWNAKGKIFNDTSNKTADNATGGFGGMFGKGK